MVAGDCMTDSLDQIEELDIRELLKTYLPKARAAYIKTWQQLGDANTPLTKRRELRAQAVATADKHAAFCLQLEEAAPKQQGDDQRNIVVLCEQLRRLETGIRGLTKLSPHALATAESVSPKAVGCGAGPRTKNDETGIRPGSSRAVRLRPEPKTSRRGPASR